MLEPGQALAAPSGRTEARARVWRLVAVGAAVAAAAVFLVRLPAALDDFDKRASFNASRTPMERTIAAADGIDVDNQFLVAALTKLPQHATYTFQRSQSVQVAATYGIGATTWNGLPGYVEYLLLPRREVDPAQAQYVLCYACDTDPFDKRMHRIWVSPNGGYVIGRLER